MLILLSTVRLYTNIACSARACMALADWFLMKQSSSAAVAARGSYHTHVHISIQTIYRQLFHRPLLQHYPYPCTTVHALLPAIPALRRRVVLCVHTTVWRLAAMIAVQTYIFTSSSIGLLLTTLMRTDCGGERSWHRAVCWRKVLHTHTGLSLS